MYQEIPQQLISEVNGITDRQMEELLNKGNCFDFDYTPEEKDAESMSISFDMKKLHRLKDLTVERLSLCCFHTKGVGN